MKRAPVKLTLCMPETEEGMQALQACFARVHADAVMACLERLPCSLREKRALLDQVIAALREQENQ